MKKLFLLLLSFLSWCSYAQLPLESFEQATFPPPGWAVFQNDVGTSTQWAHNPANNANRPPHTGLKAAFMERQNVATGSPQDYLATPAFNVPANPQLRFWSRLTQANNQGTTYKVMIKAATGVQNEITGYADVQTWTELTLNPVTQEAYELKVVNIPASYVGQSVYIAFVMISVNNGDRWLIDDVDVVTECVAPTNLTVTGVSQVGANLNWDNPSGATSWEIEIKPISEAFTGTDLVTYSGPLPYPLAGLTPDSDYKFRVRAICTTTNISVWSSTANVSTVAPGASCEAASPITALPYTVTGNTSNFGSNYDGSPGASGCGSTNNYLSGDDVVYAYTPTQNQIISINLTNITENYTGMFVYTSCANIGVNCFGGAVNNFSTDDLSIEQLSLTAGTTYYILISTWAWPQNTGYTLSLQVENCAKPTNLTTTGASTSGITLAWQENGTATSWQYALQPAGAGIPAGSGTTTANISNVLTNLPASTAYDFYVRSDCGNGTFSSWAGPIRFNTLCEALDLPFSEGFNADSETEFCWTVVDSNGDGDAWDMNYNFDAFEGNQVAVMYTDGNGGENDDWLISPTINLTGNQRLKYHYKSQSTFEPDAFEVLLSTAGVDPVSFTTTLVPLVNSNNQQYIEVIVNLVNGSNVPFSGPVNIAWHVPDGGPDGWRLFIDNVIIEDIPSCPDPLNLTATNQTENAATLSWTPGFNETAWSIVVQPQGTGAPTGAGTTVPGTLPTYSATGLTPSTAYEFYIRANCAADDQSNWVGPYLFMTTQIPAQLNYTQDFETAQTGWSLGNGSQENKWFIGTAVNNGGTHALYISNDNGATNNYNITSASNVHAYRDIQMPASVDQISVSFDWRAIAESCCDYINVWMVPVSFVPTPGVQITAGNSGGTQIAGNLNSNGTFTTENYVISATEYSGDIARFIFEWHNDGSVGTTPPAAIDNVIISVITCPSPSNLEVNDITLNEATVTWEEPVSVSPDYDYYVSETTTAPNASTVPTGTSDDNTAALTNLTESTIYYVWVRSNCGTTDGNSFWVGPVEFHTQCGPFNTPFYEGFNSDSSSEFCWTVTDENADGNTWNMNTTFNQFEGNQTASLNTYFGFGDNDDWLISPTIILAPNQRLKFRYKVSSTFEPNHFEVLLSTTGTNPESFTNVIIPLATVGNGNYIESVTNIDGYTGPVHIAWHVPANGPSGWELYIDNVIIEQIPACPEPTDVEVSCLSSTGANFTWSPGGTETSWEIAVVGSGAQIPESGIPVTEPEYFTDDLTAETGYNFYVRAVCPDDEGFGSWVSLNFQTPTTSVLDAQGFCASEGSAILFNNTFGGANEPYGAVACLYSTPNPVWYYLQVDSPGDLNFQIIQNTAFDANGNPVGQGLDVDFVAFGPFTALTEACTDIDLVQCPTCPNNTTNPNFYPVAGTNIIDCSYDGAFIENFTIPNVVTGQIYAVLITNFNGSQGQIKLEQLPTSTATTNCNVAYNVALGEDKTVCGATETTITATVTSPGNSQEPEFEWLEDGEPFTPVIVSTVGNTQTIEVTATGGVHEYSVVVTVENASNTEPITDTIQVTFGPEVIAVEPQDFVICDNDTDGFALFDLTTLDEQVLGTLNPDDFSVQYFTTETNATNNVNAITAPAAFTNTIANSQIVYARVQSTLAPVCFDTVPVQLLVSAAPVIVVDNTLIICSGTTGTIAATPIANATYKWYNEGTLITGQTTNNLPVTEGGTYALEVTVGNCIATEQIIVTAIPLPDFDVPATVVICNGIAEPIEVTPVSFDPNDPNIDVTYTWTLGSTTLPDTGSSISATLPGTYTVTVAIDGCISLPSQIVVTEGTLPAINNFTSVQACGSYTLRALTIGGSYFTGPNGTGTQLQPNDVVTQSIIPLYIYAVSAEGCFSQSSFNVEILPEPVFNLGGPYVVCRADSAFIQVNAESDFQNATYQWSFNGTTISATGSSINATEFGTYEVKVTIGQCSSVQSVEVTQDTAGFDIAFESECEGVDYIVEAMPVDGSFNPDTAQYLWTSNVSGFVPATTRMVTLRTKGTYILTVTTTDGCVVSEEFVTNSTYCMIQKGISPNNDGSNDSFDLTAYEVRHLAIFNRYGTEVYSFNNYTNQWIGQGSNGDELPTGTYYYMIERYNGEQHTGWIYINREEN